MNEMANPLREGLQGERIPPPTTMVIFGASGDLTKRKLVPALYSLMRDRLLPPIFNVVGVARREIPDATFRQSMRESTNKYARRRPVEDELWQSFSDGLFYVNGTFEDPATYERLKKRLADIDSQRDTGGNRVFYLSTPPSEYPIIVKQLGAAGLINRDKNGPFTRVIIEKPFGRDLESAISLNKEVHAVLREDQTYRIDHYLGKETVQNILAFRFANGIWEPLWNGRYIDHVQLTVAEAIGVEGRGGYFEQAGIVRDMVQNHMFQFLCLSAMEPPVAFEAEAVRDEKLKVLRCLRPLPTDAKEVERYVVRGQYGKGFVNGQEVIAYRDEQGVAKDSVVETYVALKLSIDNWRWAGVPFYLRTGKRLPRRESEIYIEFKKLPLSLFGRTCERMAPNGLALSIQPQERISLELTVKYPGMGNEPGPAPMVFDYAQSFRFKERPVYERVLFDCIRGDLTLFPRQDAVETTWARLDPVVAYWESHPPARLPNYASGSWGPREAFELMARDGRAWRFSGEQASR